MSTRSIDHVRALIHAADSAGGGSKDTEVSVAIKDSDATERLRNRLMACSEATVRIRNDRS